MRRFVVIVAVAAASVISLGAAEPDQANVVAAGSTLRVVHSGNVPTPDPALTGTPLGWGALWYATCATLFAFHDAAAPRGFTVHPEGAVGAPRVSRDGRRYVFTVRKGLRFSDGTQLTAANYARALQRVLDPRMRSEGAALFADVRRVTASGRRLLVELRKPSGSLPLRLALPYACPVPAGFPVDPAGVPLLLGSGPYFVATYDRDRSVVLQRNVHYRGHRPRKVDRLVLTVAGDLESNIRAVAEGRAEVLATEVPSEVRVELARRYGINRSQFFMTRGALVTALQLNTSRPLFKNNPRLRRAVNLAVDRTALVRAATGPLSGRTPTDQLLTRWMPGWVDHRLYPLAGRNLPLARRLAAGNLRGGRAILWTSNLGPLDVAAMVTRDLHDIGLQVEVKPLATAVINARGGAPGAAYDIILGSLPVLYPDPAAVIVSYLAGANARKASGNSNFAYFDMPSYDRRIAAADRLTGTKRLRAFAQLDSDVMRKEAPWAPLFEHSNTLFVSTNVGCLKLHPVFRLDAAAVCVR